MDLIYQIRALYGGTHLVTGHAGGVLESVNRFNAGFRSGIGVTSLWLSSKSLAVPGTSHDRMWQNNQQFHAPRLAHPCTKLPKP